LPRCGAADTVGWPLQFQDYRVEVLIDISGANRGIQEITTYCSNFLTCCQQTVSRIKERLGVVSDLEFVRQTGVQENEKPDLSSSRIVAFPIMQCLLWADITTMQRPGRGRVELCRLLKRGLEMWGFKKGIVRTPRDVFYGW
jgi:hypothetical protein